MAWNPQSRWQRRLPEMYSVYCELLAAHEGERPTQQLERALEAVELVPYLNFLEHLAVRAAPRANPDRVRTALRFVVAGHIETIVARTARYEGGFQRGRFWLCSRRLAKQLCRLLDDLAHDAVVTELGDIQATLQLADCSSPIHDQRVGRLTVVYVLLSDQRRPAAQRRQRMWTDPLAVEWPAIHKEIQPLGEAGLRALLTAYARGITVLWDERRPNLRWLAMVGRPEQDRPDADLRDNEILTWVISPTHAMAARRIAERVHQRTIEAYYGSTEPAHVRPGPRRATSLWSVCDPGPGLDPGSDDRTGTIL